MNAMNNLHAKGWKATLAALAFALVSTPAPAEIISTEEVLPSSDRDRVQTFLDREGVRDALEALGVPPEEARERVGAMTPGEIREVAGKLDALPAGGALDRTDLILILILVLLIIIVA